MGFPRTEGAVQNWRDCLGAAIRPAPRVAYRNRCRRLQPPVPRQTFCPPPQKKPGLARKYGRGEKSATRIRHAGKYRVSFGGPRWRRPRIQQYKNDSLQRLFPPPKDPHLDSRYLGPWFPQPRALFFFTENGRPGHVTAPLGEQAVGSPHWSPGRQKSRRVDFSHRGHAAAPASTERKLQCSSSFRRSRLLGIGGRRWEKEDGLQPFGAKSRLVCRMACMRSSSCAWESSADSPRAKSVMNGLPLSIVWPGCGMSAIAGQPSLQDHAAEI